MKHSRKHDKHKPKASWALSPELRRRLLQQHGAASRIAKIARVDRSHVSRVLHGKKRASTRVLAAVAEYLGIFGDEILREAIKMNFLLTVSPEINAGKREE